jgi:hypothetical protein
MPVDVPCGRCIGCRLERSRQWAVRCVHEASLHEDNCFITLTYDDAHLPPGGSLVKRDFVLFMKRFRKMYGSGIRFFHCGEYGTLLDRPHHHACIFGFDFPDKVFWSSRANVPLFRSLSLETLWPFGFSTVGAVTFESAAYVARYVLKKITGDDAADHYGGLEPEYVTMSRRPGIARGWFDKYKDDVYPADRVVVREKFICKPPRYYDNIYDTLDPDSFLAVKARRKCRARDSPDNAPDRLAVREEVKKLKAKQLKRGYEGNEI